MQQAEINKLTLIVFLKFPIKNINLTNQIENNNSTNYTNNYYIEQVCLIIKNKVHEDRCRNQINITINS